MCFTVGNAHFLVYLCGKILARTDLDLTWTGDIRISTLGHVEYYLVIFFYIFMFLFFLFNKYKHINKNAVGKNGVPLPTHK